MSLPYYKRYPKDFFEATVGMSGEVKGAYGLLLDIIYMLDGKLPDDPRYISGLLGISVRKWKTIKNELIERGKIQAENNIISNLKADYLLEERRSYRDKKSENRTKSNKNKEKEKRSSYSARVKPKPDTKDTIVSLERARESSHPSKPKRKAPPRGAARASQIPDSWGPSPTNYATAQKYNLTNEEVSREADKFIHHANANQRRQKNWSAAFSQWLIRSAEFKQNARSGHTSRDGSGGTSFAGVIARAEGYTERGAPPAWADPNAMEGEFEPVAAHGGHGPAKTGGRDDRAHARPLLASGQANQGNGQRGLAEAAGGSANGKSASLL